MFVLIFTCNVFYLNVLCNCLQSYVAEFFFDTLLGTDLVLFCVLIVSVVLVKLLRYCLYSRVTEYLYLKRKSKTNEITEPELKVYTHIWCSGFHVDAWL